MTPHFELDEFLKGDKNPPAEAIPLVLALCENVLEPVREWAGCPVVITSGWRPPAQNIASGGAATSDHRWSSHGTAIDFTFECDNPKAKLKDCHDWLWQQRISGVDQCILEWGEQEGDWRCIHVGWRGAQGRQMYGYGATGNRSKYRWLK